MRQSENLRLRLKRETGQVRAKSCLRGNNESRKKAAKTYIQSGRSLQETINQLGYNVSQRTIQNWVKKFYPNARKLNHNPIKFHSKRFSWEMKIKAVYAMRQTHRSVFHRPRLSNNPSIARGSNTQSVSNPSATRLPELRANHWSNGLERPKQESAQTCHRTKAL